jgi:hypothetical protein
MEFIQIHISEPFWTKLCKAPPWSGRDRRIYMYPKFSTSSTLRSLFFGGHCRIMGTKWLPARPFFAILLYPWFQLVFAWRHQHNFVADGGVILGNLISVILAGVPLASYHLFRRVFASRHGYYVHPGDKAIHHSVISLILAPVSVTYRKSRPCRQQLRVPTPSVLHCR